VVSRASVWSARSRSSRSTVFRSRTSARQPGSAWPRAQQSALSCPPGRSRPRGAHLAPSVREAQWRRVGD
jgi:hypothetical protein